jgi:hypothetical protein
MIHSTASDENVVWPLVALLLAEQPSRVCPSSPQIIGVSSHLSSRQNRAEASEAMRGSQTAHHTHTTDDRIIVIHLAIVHRFIDPKSTLGAIKEEKPSLKYTARLIFVQ